MDENKLYVAFVWHMHQPYYKDTFNNLSLFPWVRLHAIKNYYNMVSILKNFPKIKQTFNLVPSLLMQIEEYLNGTTTDLWLKNTLKRVDDLDEDERKFIKDNFFLLNKEKMGFIFDRFKELYDKKLKNEDYSNQDYLDLQVLYNLAWFDPEFREKDEFLRGLCKKGRFFSEEEKTKVIEKQFYIIKNLFSLYKEMQDSGQIEIIFSPFFHPILPLLVSTENAKISTPDLPLPSFAFSYPEDAKTQIILGREYYKKIFSKEPIGMWPSEEAVSPEVITLCSDLNIKWIITDEKILGKTIGKEIVRDRDGNVLNPEILYKPYRVNINGKEVNVVFRDQFLSDRIGFVYMNMNPYDAAKDLYERIIKIKDRLPKDQSYLLTIALDGENCWEYYDNDGRDFLRHLYTLIEESDEVETTTVGDFILRNPPKDTLNYIFTGSWINADLTTWIGELEENLAWDYLSLVRAYLERGIRKTYFDKDSLDWKSLWAAEGSDWFWWYGDDQDSGHDEIFDYIFRVHLKNVFKSLNRDYPTFLDFPIVFKNPIWKSRESFIFTPKIDGKVSFQEEWKLSSLNLLEEDGLIKGIYYGYDLENIYIRIDIKNGKACDFFNKEISLKLNFRDYTKEILSLEIPKDNNKTSLREDIFWALDEIVEIKVPFSMIFLNNEKLLFNIQLLKDTKILESYPKDSKGFKVRKPGFLEELITKLYLQRENNKKVAVIESFILKRKEGEFYNLYTKAVIEDKDFDNNVDLSFSGDIFKIRKIVYLDELILFLRALRDLNIFTLSNYTVFYPFAYAEKLNNLYILKPKNSMRRFINTYMSKCHEEKNLNVEMEKLGSIEIYGL
jgi:alpha-amylase/alpha-mannosidase (GH57 family)